MKYSVSNGSAAWFPQWNAGDGHLSHHGLSPWTSWTFKFLCCHWKISTCTSFGSDFHFLNHIVAFAIITLKLCWNLDILPVADFQVDFFLLCIYYSCEFKKSIQTNCRKLCVVVIKLKNKSAPTSPLLILMCHDFNTKKCVNSDFVLEKKKKICNIVGNYWF